MANTAQVEAVYAEALSAGYTAQTEAVYAEALAAGRTSQVEAVYAETLARRFLGDVDMVTIDESPSFGTTWQQIGSNELVINASAGDVIDLGASMCVAAGAVNFPYFDFATVVAGAVVNWVSTGTNSHTGSVLSLFQYSRNAINNVSGNQSYVVQSGDVVNGKVYFRLYAKTSTSTRTINTSIVWANCIWAAKSTATTTAACTGTLPASWGQIGTSITIAAAAGDVLQISPSIIVNTNGTVNSFDCATIVSGSPLGYASSQSTTQASGGVGAWRAVSADYESVGGSMLYTVQADDVVSGNVTLSMMGTCPTGTTTLDSASFWSVRKVSLPTDIKRRTTSLTASNTILTQSDSTGAFDVSLACSEGDWVELGVSFLTGSSGTAYVYDFRSNVSGRYVSDYVQPGSSTLSSVNVPGWYNSTSSPANTGVGGSILYRIQADDIDVSGNAAFRLYYRRNGAGTTAVTATSTDPAAVFVVKRYAVPAAAPTATPFVGWGLPRIESSGSAALTINDIAGKKLWLHPDTLGAAGALSVWPDSSPENRQTQLLGAAPTIQTAQTPGGRKAVSFTGAYGIDMLPPTDSMVFASSYYSTTYLPINAVDGSVSTYWHSGANTLPQWWSIRFPTASVATGINIQPWNGAASGPGTFTVQGSNDNSSWTDLDSRTGITWTGGVTQTFTFSNSTPYQYYRLYVTAAPDGWLRIGEISFVGVTITTTASATQPRNGEVWYRVKSDYSGSANNEGIGEFGSSASSSHYGFSGSVYDDAGSTTRYSFVPTMGLDSWRTYRIRVTGGLWVAYLDGVLQATQTFPAQSWPLIPRVGGSRNGNGQGHSGKIAAVLAFDRALTVEEAAVVDNYLSGL